MNVPTPYCGAFAPQRHIVRLYEEGWLHAEMISYRKNTVRSNVDLLFDDDDTRYSLLRRDKYLSDDKPVEVGAWSFL